MGAETRLVGLEDIGAHDLALNLCDVSMSVGPKPVRQSLLTGHVRIEHIRVAGCDNSVEDIPDGIVICLVCRSNHGEVHKSPNARVERPRADGWCAPRAHNAPRCSRRAAMTLPRVARTRC